MKATNPLLATILSVAILGSVASADSTSATCEIRRDGHENAEASGPCTFSQRQGYIDLDLKNGNTFSLSPGKKPDHFTDKNGKQVVRTRAGGDTQVFKWDNGRRVIVTFGGAPSGDAGSDGGGGGRVAQKDMSRFCAGEASAKFKQSPRDITTQAPTKGKGMFSVWGQYPAEPSPQVFICTFSAEGRFVGVDLYKP